MLFSSIRRPLTTSMNAIRANGVFISEGGIRLISSIVHSCVNCRRLRGYPAGQKMANFPEERTTPSVPFIHAGMDEYSGPFLVKDGRREFKRYVVLFTCPSSRTVHLEMLDEMTTDSFINALRIFLSIRGPVSSLHFDRGTNFIGANNELK